MKPKLIGKKVQFLSALLSVVIALNFGCKKLVDVQAPVTASTNASVYTNDQTAIAVLTGIYANLSKNFNGGMTSMSLFAGLSSDELTLYSGVSDPTYVAYYTNALTSTNTTYSDFWNAIYPTIFVANSAIEGLTSSNSLTPEVKTILLGESKFMRAFCYFYLVNFYGDVPLVIGTDYSRNALYPRTPKAQVYQQIISDLKDAQNQLSSNYVNATLIKTTGERVRPNRWAAKALLARVYLYLGDWQNAEIQADSVINNVSRFNLDVNLDDVFLKNNTEAIWQIQPVTAGYNTFDADIFILTSGPNSSYNSFWISQQLQSAFEIGDKRFTNWIGVDSSTGTKYYYPFKYKVPYGASSVTEYIMVLRLAEQYLIRAEARAQQGNISGAAADLNTIRTRAGLANTSANTQSGILDAILHERQVELFTEWGNRWFELKRTNTVNGVMSINTPQKGGVWNPDWQFYPIPASDLLTDHNLVQNAGYGN